MTFISSLVQRVGAARQWLVVGVLALVGGGLITAFVGRQSIAYVARPFSRWVELSQLIGRGSYLTLYIFAAIAVMVPLMVTVTAWRLDRSRGGLRVAHAVRTALMAVVLGGAGALFAYFFNIPAAAALAVLLGNDTTLTLLTAPVCLHFALLFIVCFAALFQVPLIVRILDDASMLSIRGVKKGQFVFLPLSFVASGVLVGKFDVKPMLLMALPLIALYELFFMYTWWLADPDEERDVASSLIPEVDVPDDIVSRAPKTHGAPQPVVPAALPSWENPQLLAPVPMPASVQQPAPRVMHEGGQPIQRRDFTTMVRPRVALERPLARTAMAEYE